MRCDRAVRHGKGMFRWGVWGIEVYYPCGHGLHIGGRER